MSFGDIMGGLIFETQDSNQGLSDRSYSDSDSSSDEDDKIGIMGSFFGFMGFGRNNRRNKHSNTNCKEQSNVYDYKPSNIRESSSNHSKNKNIHIVSIKTLKHKGVEIKNWTN